MSLRFFLLFAVACTLITSEYSVLSAQQHPVSGERGTLRLSDVHERSTSKCNLCHPPTADIENSAVFLKSDLCLDCHDNIVAIMPEARLRSGIPAMNNHPIKFTPLDFDPKKISHNIISVGGKFFVSGPSGTLPLFGKTERSAIVECATCHDPHGDSGHQKLRRLESRRGTLCKVCHLGY